VGLLITFVAILYALLHVHYDAEATEQITGLEPRSIR
jgi:hypothetical protein